MLLPRILLDCEPLKDRNSGFSHFVVPLAHELIRQNHRYRLYCYVPPHEVGGRGHADGRYLTQRSFHKYLNPPSYGFRLWHATSQLSWYVPTSPFTKVVLAVHDLHFLHENPDERTHARQLAMVRRNVQRADYAAARRAAAQAGVAGRLTSLPEVSGDAAYYFDNFSAETMRQTLAAGLALARAGRGGAGPGQPVWLGAGGGRVPGCL